MLSLPATLTNAQASSALGELEPALRAWTGPGPMGLDAASLLHFDTAALAVLLQCQRSAQAAGHALKVRGAPAKLVELARLYGVEGLLGLVVEDTQLVG